jgi:hypothetical protein
MKVLEITSPLSETADIRGAIGAAAPTAISMIAPQLLSKYPALGKIAALSPYAAQIVQQLAMGQITAAGLTALQNLAPEAGVLPKEINMILSHWSNAGTFTNIGKSLGGEALAGSAVLPSALAMPWMLAAEERKKIDADPWNKQYDNNPYAMSVRSGGKVTQGQAAAQNQRNAVKNFSTAGNPAIQEVSLPATSLPQYQPTIANPHAEEPVAATSKEVAGTTVAKEVGKEVTKAAIENAIKFAEAVEASVAKLIPRFQAGLIPGAEQIVALYLFGKGLVKQQWTAAVAGAATAIPLAAIPAMAAEMASELYGTYFVKEPSHRPADITVDTVKDPQGTKQRLAQLTTEIAKALDKWTKAGWARTKELNDPKSPNSLARVTARNSVHTVGPDMNKNGVFESLEHIIKLADVKKPT